MLVRPVHLENVCLKGEQMGLHFLEKPIGKESVRVSIFMISWQF